jgi:hypothetical protein
MRAGAIPRGGCRRGKEWGGHAAAPGRYRTSGTTGVFTDVGERGSPSVFTVTYLGEDSS